MPKEKPKVIALYLPQFHPIPENDLWWGKGFTEWTNVGKAKPLFKGHIQPRVPADLGYYDLRLPEARQAQADLAMEYGVDGFCYWHYWFGNGKRLLERPFNEVLASGKPDFPFCLAWANHSWEDKLFNKAGSNKLLIKQEYLGEEDYRMHFDTLLPAFKDGRYMKKEGSPIFLIFNPLTFDDSTFFMNCWQKWAKEAGMPGIHFVAQCNNPVEIDNIMNKGYQAINLVGLFNFKFKVYSYPVRIYNELIRRIFKRGLFVDYGMVSKYFINEHDEKDHIYSSIIPNWDHSPRSGRTYHNLFNATPEAFYAHVKNVLNINSNKHTKDQIIFLRAWNEWAEGNYIEPDLTYGRGHLEKLKLALDEYCNQ